jgi:isopenicillin-N N-acyltransferase like protein
MRRYYSAPAAPFDRGRKFGADHATDIVRVLGKYDELFGAATGGGEIDVMYYGAEAMTVIDKFSAALGDEIRGIAAGANVEPERVAALNARTEILAAVGAALRSECSTIVYVGDGSRSPVSVQTWDWHDLFTDECLLWTIDHLDGRRTTTVTEFGIVGKVGVNDRGVGLHLNILHHGSDGGPIGVPVHVLARTVLDEASDISEAMTIVSSAVTSASTVLTLIEARDGRSSAVCAELCPQGPRYVLPSTDGWLFHTNHFLDPKSAAGDREPRIGPDSFVRLDVLRRALAGRADVTMEELVDKMRSHVGGAGAVCCHAAGGAALGDRWATLALISLDVAHGTLRARLGGPCSTVNTWTHPILTGGEGP